MRTVVLWLTAYALAILSALLASQYGFKMEASFWGGLLRAVAIGAVAIFAVHSFAWARRTYRGGGKAAGVAIALTGVLAFFVAIAGGVGNLSFSADIMTSPRETAIGTRADNLHELTRLKAAISELPKHRPAATVQPLLEEARGHERFRTSRECDPRHITLPESREHCRLFRLLEAELGAAQKAVELEAKVDAVRARLGTAGNFQDADAQGASLSRLLFGLIDAKTASTLYFAGLSAVLELAGMLSMLAAEITSAGGATRKEVPPAPAITGEVIAAPQPSRALIAKPVGSVAKFLADTVEMREGAMAERREVYSIYLGWCGAKKLVPVDEDRFADDFADVCDRAGIKTETDAGALYALDIKLLPPPRVEETAV